MNPRLELICEGSGGTYRGPRAFSGVHVESPVPTAHLPGSLPSMRRRKAVRLAFVGTLLVLIGMIPSMSGLVLGGLTLVLLDRFAVAPRQRAGREVVYAEPKNKQSHPARSA